MVKRRSLNYEVGYKRPPTASQFKPGESGNRNGRPKGSRNFSTELDRELNKVVTVTENGIGKTVRKKAVIAKQLVNKAASGDLKAAGMLLAQSRTDEGVAAPSQSIDEPLAPEDQEVLAVLLDRLRAYAQQAPKNESAGIATPPEHTARRRHVLND
jgi:hypothetical protein